MKKLQMVWAGIAVFAIIYSLHAQTAISIRPVIIHAPVSSSSDDLNTMLEAVEATTPTPATSVPVMGTFHSAQNPLWPPLPGNLNNTPAWDLGDGIWLLDDLDIDYNARAALFSRGGGGMHAMDEGPPSPGDGDGGTNSSGGGGFSADFSFPTNNLWLHITNVSSGLANLNLMNGTDSVYEIYSTVALVNGSNNWTIEQEVWPTNPAVMPFIVPELDRTNLFIWARDWTGITSLGNTVPEWWFWKYFGTVDLLDTNRDSLGFNRLGYDYSNNVDPNVIEFYFDLPPGPVTSNTVNSTIDVADGTPAFMAMLVNDTNQADAVWQPYSSNIVVNLDSGNGTYNVMVGLRGLPADATQTWHSQWVALYSVTPSLTITNPVSSTVSVPMIQLQGLVNEPVTGISYDISNATGIFTNQQGYWQAAFYDTNLLTFTTNSFQCYDVPLTNGVNLITLHVANAGNTITTNISYTLSYAGVTNPPALNLIWPTNGTVIGGSNFTMQAQIGDATASAVASIMDTNGDTNIVQGLVERSGVVWFNDLPLNSGTNLVTITATSAAGNVNTTNINVVESSVSLSFDPLSSDQMNRTNVSVTGSIGNLADNVSVNGANAYFIDDVGDWEADGVAMSPGGTASLNVQVSDASNNPLASQNVYQPQPAQVMAVSYAATEYTSGVKFGEDSAIWPFADDSVSGWAMGQGGYWQDSGWGERFDGDEDFGPYSTDDSGSLTGAGAWENVLGSFALVTSGENAILQESVQTHVVIEPAGQQGIGQSALYLVMAQVMDEDSGLQLAASAVQFMHQLAGTTTEDVTNSDGSVWTEAVVSGPAGAQIEATPIAAGNISFTGMKTARTKTDWQQMVRDEIEHDSYGVDIQSYLAANTFVQNTPYIKAVYEFYQKVYLEQPTEYYWAGLAKLAGAPVYGGLDDAQYAGLTTFQQTLMQMNINILQDLAWQFEAYRKGGLDALEEIYAVDSAHTNLDLNAITAWQNIDQGIQQTNQALVLSGNEALLHREQQQVLAFGYATLSSMTGITTLMSILADCPIWDYDPGHVDYNEPFDGRDFLSVVGIGHNIANFDDRWTWITTPTYGIWDTWVNMYSSDQTNQVSVPLTTRAATYANLPLLYP